MNLCGDNGSTVEVVFLNLNSTEIILFTMFNSVVGIGFRDSPTFVAVNILLDKIMTLLPVIYTVF